MLHRPRRPSRSRRRDKEFAHRHKDTRSLINFTIRHRFHFGEQIRQTFAETALAKWLRYVTTRRRALMSSKSRSMRTARKLSCRKQQRRGSH